MGKPEDEKFKVERASVRSRWSYRYKNLQRSMWNKFTFLTDFWKDHDEINLKRVDDDIARLQEKRNELINSSKDNSPTHSNPETEEDRVWYFRKPKIIITKDNSSQSVIDSMSNLESNSPIPKPSKSPLYSSEAGNDSTETIRPFENPRGYESPKWSENTPLDVTASEMTPLIDPYSQIEDSHTYPLKKKGVSLSENKGVRFSEYQNQPFARGYNEAIDPSEVNINKRSSLVFGFGASIADKMDESLKKNN